jgi:hypothetical protein
VKEILKEIESPEPACKVKEILKEIESPEPACKLKEILKEIESPEPACKVKENLKEIQIRSQLAEHVGDLNLQSEVKPEEGWVEEGPTVDSLPF